MSTAKGRLQFGTAALLWLMVTLGMTFAYVTRLTPEDQYRGLVFAAFALIGAAVMGLVTRNGGDAWFWSVLVTLLAYLAVVGERTPDRSMVYGWAAVAALCGG